MSHPGKKTATWYDTGVLIAPPTFSDLLFCFVFVFVLFFCGPPVMPPPELWSDPCPRGEGYLRDRYVELLGEVGFDTSAMTKVRTGVRVCCFVVVFIYASVWFGFVPSRVAIGKPWWCC